MDLIEKARELGIALANSGEFIRMKEAQSAIAENESVSNLLQELQVKRLQLVQLMSGDDQDSLGALSLTNDIERLQGQMQENPLILELAASESEFSALVSAVDDEINACIGHTRSGCGGDCGGCGGCAH